MVMKNGITWTQEGHSLIGTREDVEWGIYPYGNGQWLVGPCTGEDSQAYDSIEEAVASIEAYEQSIDRDTEAELEAELQEKVAAYLKKIANI